MVSVYYAAFIAGIIFFIIYGIKLRKEIPVYSGVELWIGFIAYHVFPILMIEHRMTGIYVNFLIDMAIIAGMYFFFSKTEKDYYSSVLANYIFNPFVLVAMVSADYVHMLGIIVVIVAMAVINKTLKHKYEQFNMHSFYGEYLVATAGAFLYNLASDVKGQNISNIFMTEKVPVAMSLSLILLAVAAILGIIRVTVTKKLTLEFVKEKASKEIYVENPVDYKKKFTSKDKKIMFIITIAYFLITICNVGTLKAPESYMRMTTMQERGNEIVLEFNSDVTISKVWIYLGFQGKRIISFSTFNYDTNSWEVFDSKREIPSAFCWNKINVNKTTKRLAMVCMDSSADIHEIIILDSNNNVIKPANYLVYEKLFDEQDTFPEYDTYYYRTMFDEVYHGRTAYEFLHNLAIYENTHPPLGKTIISIGIAIFGMNPFGWRFMCVVCGALMIPFMYLFAWKISRKTEIATMAAILLATECSHFSLSRIATIDIIVALFILMMFYYMYGFTECLQNNGDFTQQCKILALAGVSMACGISTKWTGFYSAAGIAIIFFVAILRYSFSRKFDKKTINYLTRMCVFCIMAFIVGPFIIYSLSYIQFSQVYFDKNIFQHVWDNGKLMLNYHAKTVFSHPYSSEWYEWIVDRKPLLDAYTNLDSGYISTIATFVNPLVAWGGLVAFIYNVYLWRCKKDRNAETLIIAYLAMLLPWLLIHRTVFIYQYYGCTLMLILMIANAICHLGKTAKSQKKIINTVIITTCALFVLFYPVISGVRVNYDYVNTVLEWLGNWKFAL